jgi:hypothetical protein
MLQFARAWVLLGCVVVVQTACVTTHVSRALYTQKSFAVVSVAARKGVTSWGMEMSPLELDNEFGSEVIEMTLGDEQDRLARVLDTERGGVELMRVEDVVQHPAYAHVHETADAEDWSRVGNMVTVDLTPAADASLGDLATALDVDAVLALRHEWAILTERTSIGLVRSMVDHCTLVVVDRHGVRLWDDAVDARVPVWGMGVDLGFNGSSWADALRSLARRSATEALEELATHHRRDRPKATAAKPVTTSNPPEPTVAH